MRIPVELIEANNLMENFLDSLSYVQLINFAYLMEAVQEKLLDTECLKEGAYAILEEG